MLINSPQLVLIYQQSALREVFAEKLKIFILRFKQEKCQGVKYYKSVT